MRTPLLLSVSLAGALAVAACGGSSPMSPTPMSPGGPPAASSGLTGTWTGSSLDSSGSMMGAGLSSAMMSGMTWQITQTGNTFTGTMSFQGYHGGAMTVTGTIAGTSGTFTMTMPAGTMMMSGCTATATGTFDIDDLMDQIHGSYSGSNTCTGAFNQGQVSMSHR